MCISTSRSNPLKGIRPEGRKCYAPLGANSPSRRTCEKGADSRRLRNENLLRFSFRNVPISEGRALQECSVAPGLMQSHAATCWILKDAPFRISRDCATRTTRAASQNVKCISLKISNYFSLTFPHSYFPPLRAAAGGSTHVAYTRSGQIAPISPNTTTELPEPSPNKNRNGGPSPPSKRTERFPGTSWQIMGRAKRAPAYKPARKFRGRATVLRIAGIHMSHSFFWDESAMLQLSV